MRNLSGFAVLDNILVKSKILIAANMNLKEDKQINK